MCGSRWATRPPLETDDTATAGSDFTAVTSGTLTFMHGATTQTISVDLVPDTEDEENETFTVTLSGPAAAGSGSSTPTLASPMSVQGTIIDDDGPPLLSIAAATAEAEEDDESTIHFVVSLDPASAKDVSARWSTADVTAEAGSDYTAAGGMLTIARGDTSTTVSVDLLDDEEDEPPETFTVTLSDPVNGALSAAKTAPRVPSRTTICRTVTIAAVSTPVTEGTPAEFKR